MRILNRYLGYTILQYTMIAMLMLLALFIFITCLDQLSSIGKGNYNLKEVITYVALVTPRTIYELFPMAALLGTIIGLSLLANDSELIIMRASGISLKRITTATLKMGGIFVIAAVLIGELIAPYTETRAQRGRAEALQEDIKQQTNFGLWMRDAESYVNIGEVLPDLTLLQIKVFEFDEARRLRSLVQAEKASFQDARWLLQNVHRTLIHHDGLAEVSHAQTAHWKTEVSPQILSVFLIKPEQMSFFQLGHYINHLRENQQQTDPYELAFWNRIILPLSTAVMVVLAIPFVFIHVRSGALGRNLFIGIMLGISFYAINKGFGLVAIANNLPPLLGATAPAIAFLILALTMLRRVE